LLRTVRLLVLATLLVGGSCYLVTGILAVSEIMAHQPPSRYEGLGLIGGRAAARYRLDGASDPLRP
jgi:hypothetical protein